MSDVPPARPVTYQFRPSLLQREQTYHLTERALVQSGSGAAREIPFADIAMIRIYGSPGARTIGGPVSSGFARCVVCPTHGRAVVVASRHFVGLGNFEDRSDSFTEFTDALVARVAAANPATVFRAGMPVALWLTWVFIALASVVVTPLLLVVFVVEMADNVAVTLIAAAVYLAIVAVGLAHYGRKLWRIRARPFDPRAGG